MSTVCAVAVVEDEEALNRTMAALLEHAGHRVQRFGSGEALLDARDFLTECDCVLLDIQLPGMSGLDVLKLLQDREDAPAVVVLTGAGDVPTAVEAMRLGAFDFIEKPYLPTALLDSVDKAARLAGRRRATQAAGREAAARLRQLSHRQRQVLAGIVEGQSSKIIADNLHLSVRTVEAYRAQLLTKLGARSTTDAVRVALAAPEALDELAA
jgi:two-component system, LuxR family, response regulator FixJ